MSRMAMRWSREDGDDVGVNSLTEIPTDFTPVSDGEVEEIAEDSANMLDYSDIVDAAHDEAIQVLEVTSAIEENGQEIDTVGAEVLAVQTESIRRRLGLAQVPKLSRESLYRNTKSSITRLAAEGVSEAISSAWEKIKAFFKKMWKHVKNFWRGLFNANQKLLNRATSLKEKMRSVRKPEETSINNTAVKDAFGGEDFSFKGSEVSTLIKAFISVVDAGIDGKTSEIKSDIKSLKTIAKKLADVAKDGNLDTAALGDVAVEANSASEEIENFRIGDDGKIKINYTRTKLIFPLPGRQGLFSVTEPSTTYDSKGSLVGKFENMTFELYVDEDYEKSTDGEIDILQPAEINVIISDVTAAARALIALEKKKALIDYVEKEAEEMFDQIDKYFKMTKSMNLTKVNGSALNGASTVHYDVTIRGIRLSLHKKLKISKLIYIDFPSALFKWSTITLRYAEASVAAYKKN